MYKITIKGKANKTLVLEADRTVLQRMLLAYEAGRNVGLGNIMTHELMLVPIALADTSGALRNGDKSLLVEVLTKGVECPPSIDMDGTSCFIIDMQALIWDVGKLSECATFGTYAE